MKTIKPYIILAVSALAAIVFMLTSLKEAKGTPTKVKEVTIAEVDTIQAIDSLIEALIFVESRGKEDAVGDTHLGAPSIGVLQIRPIMVREVNRILKKKGVKMRFKLQDRFDRDKSIWMFMIWKDYHHPTDGFEKIARNWNGGPNGYRFKRTEPYWVKVKKELEI
tara:strand:+ start:1439 stop:1933 length:495 start_codon:yes stop_codon:yes gene_type:complete